MMMKVMMMMMIAEKCRDGIVRHGCGVCSLIYLYVCVLCIVTVSMWLVGGHACIYTITSGWENNLYCVYTHTHTYIYTYTQVYI